VATARLTGDHRESIVQRQASGSQRLQLVDASGGKADDVSAGLGSNGVPRPVDLPAITTVVPGHPQEQRTSEPLTFGIPLPQGTATDPGAFGLRKLTGQHVPVQCKVLERWPRDRSIRWLLVDAQLDAPETYIVHLSPEQSAITSAVRLVQRSSQSRVETAGLAFELSTGGPRLCTIFGAASSAPLGSIEVVIRDDTNRALAVQMTTITEEVTGPLRTTVRIEGIAGPQNHPKLMLTARCSWFAGHRTARFEICVRNPNRAKHKGGHWELGDPGSVLVSDISVVVRSVSRHEQVWCRAAREERPFRAGLPLAILQHSSGGPHWRTAVHINRHGDIPLTKNGFELCAPDVSRQGRRASPILWFADGSMFSVAIQDFWQNFPKALEAEPYCIVARLFPALDDAQEIQGGEQKTHVLGIGCGETHGSAQALEWILEPGLAAPAPEWFAASGVVPYLIPVSAGADHRHERLVRAAIEGEETFKHKRERIDEYGWRHFGDLYADHESVRAPRDKPLVSHYNNQYDAIWGCAIQFMRSGNSRWWTAMQQLARHVVDIDIYHTSRDKAAYNGGLFWHTVHYTDAGRATHRSYPKTEGVSGGGPSNEHIYSTGLMYLYWLTGQAWARDAVISLADWVIRVDDGNLTPFRWLSRAPTGLASATVGPGYHGPGRGAGNSILALLNAFRMTAERKYLEKAEALIRRCCHPDDDPATRDLLNREPRWSYTVFLEALARYLDDKADIGELDEMYAYARAVLLRYAQWLADHEYPYLDRPTELEFPTETWAAQEMRKCDALLYASRHAAGSQAERFRDRADFFYAASLDWLERFGTRALTRPVVLMMTHGHVHAAAAGSGLCPAPPGSDYQYGPRESFVPQKQIALRRAKVLCTTAAVLIVGTGLIAGLLSLR
jgi:hypothetical protein